MIKLARLYLCQTITYYNLYYFTCYLGFTFINK